MAASRRQSNMELLRIISMLMVLAVHIDGASLGLPDLKGDFSALDCRSAWQLTVESLAIVGVNCFTLISGYFGIRLRVRSMVSYLFQCVFYAVGIYAIWMLVAPERTSWTGLLESFLVLSHTDLWYVPAYFGLMLLSPFLNVGVESLSRRGFTWTLVGIVLFNVWCGWLWEGKFNPSGYTLVQLIMMYLVGRYIMLWTPSQQRRHPAAKMFALYLVMTALVTVSAICCLPRAYAYNSPLVIMESIALFMAFRYLRVDSQAINYVAKSAFAVYLIHKEPHLFGEQMKPAVIYMWNNNSLLMFTLYAICLMMGIYVVAMAIDAMRRYYDVKICKLLRL